MKDQSLFELDLLQLYFGTSVKNGAWENILRIFPISREALSSYIICILTVRESVILHIANGVQTKEKM